MIGNDTPAIDIFLNAAATLAKLRAERRSLTELRSAALDHLPSQIYSLDPATKNSLNEIDILVPEPAFAKLLGATEKESSVAVPQTRGLFLSPEAWHEVVCNPESTKFLSLPALEARSNILLCGFISTEYEIWESALAGFGGCLVFARSHDHYELQYFVEISRDLQKNLVVLVGNQSELQTVLKTDAPYLGVWGLDQHSFALDWSRFGLLSRMIPESALCFACGPHFAPSQKQALIQWRFRSLLSFKCPSDPVLSHDRME